MIEADQQEHWKKVYEGKASTALSWHQTRPEPSLLALMRAGASPGASFIDVGGGASNLVDVLLAEAWQDVTVLDIAPPALDAAKARLGALAGRVNWVTADITKWKPNRRFDVWHDRAVFHFLTEPKHREAYQRALSQGTSKESRVIIATFALDGPKTCSGLAVQRYDAVRLAHQLGEMFQLVTDWREEHVTPWGAAQSFTWCVFRRAS
jgi:2-polyprenyl-3-methyl-5-hydroxy-6-metoxy-1,4-benzoquinol methylase